MTGTTQRLAEFVAGLSYEKLPPDVAERTRLLVLDTAGIALRARYDAESTPSLLASVAALGLDRGGATVIGDGGGFAPSAAAMVNGTVTNARQPRGHWQTAVTIFCRSSPTSARRSPTRSAPCRPLPPLQQQLHRQKIGVTTAPAKRTMVS